MKSLAAIAVFAFLPAVSMTFAQSATQSTDPREIAAAQLHRLFEERHAWQMQQYPEWAMERGDYSNAHRITDTSLQAIQARHDQTVEHLQQLLSIDTTLPSEHDLVNYELFELELRSAVEAHRFRMFLAPISGRTGPQQDIPQMAERVRFSNYEDYANYLSRLEQVPKLVGDTIERMKLGVKEGRTLPQVTLMGIPAQFHALLDGGGLRVLGDPLARMPDNITAEQKKELEERFQTRSFPLVRDAVAKLFQFFVNEYLPHCRTSIAAIDWPEGEEFYNFQLKVMTTTDMTAREIHELGLSEVKRIRAEMMQVIRRSDFLSIHPEAAALSDDELFKAFIHYLRTDPRFYYTNAEDLLTGYRDICKRIDAHLPRFFKTLPRLPYGVMEIPRFMAPTQTTAYYQAGDIRNAQAGYFMANTYALDQRPKYEMISLAMHEAVPGHHLQIALAQELENVPEFRKDAWFHVFGEGWALYSERLGIEMGLYDDPYSDFGRLLYEMWRACRLVVDPGMHALGWSRDQAVQFMLDNTALSELNINTEIDRYIAWPGQATAYKIGELKIRALREHAERTLGPAFDIREFHDVVLGAGTVPLDVLERRVLEWVRSRQGEQ